VNDPSPRSDDEKPDDVLIRRARYQRLANSGQRLGYVLYAIAIVAFVIGFIIGFPAAVVTTIVIAMAIGSTVLLPAIIVGYAVKAAERDDREQGRI
jgi:hypothetical protein